jgi:hypothetical protein
VDSVWIRCASTDHLRSRHPIDKQEREQPWTDDCGAFCLPVLDIVPTP